MKSFLPALLLLATGLISSVKAQAVNSPATYVREGTVPYVVGKQTFQTWYKIQGFLTNSTRAPLIVVHGGPGFSHDYLSPLADLAKPYEQAVVFYDQIGNGKSSRLDNQTSDFYSVKLYINELQNVVDKLGIKEFHLFGHSWGAPLSANFVITQKPRGLKSLILTNGLATFSDATRSQIERVQTLPDAASVLAGLQARFSDIPKFKVALDTLYKAFAIRFVPDPIPKDLRITDLWFGDENGNPGDIAVAVNMGPVLANFTLVGQLDKIPVPTLLITGKWDMLQNFVTEPLFWGIQSKVKWKQFEQSSHVPFWEERPAYIQLLKEWIGNVTVKAI